MRKLLSTIAGGVVAAVALPAIAMAAPTPGSTFVSGTVTHNGSPVSGASVSVTCNGHVLGATTNATGGYAVKYAAADCPNGATATVTAADGGLNGSNSGQVNGLTSKLNVDVVNVSIVPEMGVVAGTVAAAVGVGAFMVVRQRKLNS